LEGGDGGNRTRVRKNRPSNIYECSQSLLSSMPGKLTNLALTSRLDPKALFRTIRGRVARHSDIFTPAPPPVGIRGGQM